MKEELSVTETQQVQLEILRCFRQLCTDYSLRYSLCAGTLLGAVRHQGFIPWDDDVDVYMPRKDYERLCVLSENADTRLPPYMRFQNGLARGFSFPHGKLVDTRYTVELDYVQENEGDYLGIDIFPLDGVPEKTGRKKLLYFRVMLLRKLLALTCARPGRGKTHFRAALKRVLRPLARMIGSRRISRQIDRLCRQYVMEETGCAAPVSSTVYGMREYIAGDSFERMTTLPFENTEFPVFPEYASYLGRLYGEYMTIPDENRRKRHYLHVIKTF